MVCRAARAATSWTAPRRPARAAFRLTAVDTNGYSGSEQILGTQFSGIDWIVGTGSDSDRLYGVTDTAATWTLNGSDSTYQVDGSTLSLHYEAIELLYGSTGDDTFIITGDETARVYAGAGHDVFVLLDQATLDGTLDGGGGTNTLDYSAYTTPVTVDLSIFEATGVTSMIGIQNVIGGSANDELTGNNGDNMLNGMGGDDILSGGLGDDIYQFFDTFGSDIIIESEAIEEDTIDMAAVTEAIIFDLPNAQVEAGANTITFDNTQIENFIGGSNDDTFKFGTDYSLPNSGTLDGSDGSDTLDYSNYNIGVTVDLANGTATGTGGISNLENVTGTIYSDNLAGNDQDNVLAGGAGDDTYIFSGDVWGSNQIIDDSGVDILDMSLVNQDLLFNIGLTDLVISGDGDGLTTLNNIETLLGGLLNDTFAFADGAVLAGGGLGTFIDGGAGSNTLDYSAYTSEVYINLGEKIATGLNAEQAGGYDNIQNVAGGSADNTIYGDDGDNTIISTSGNDHLYGLGGNDTYIFRDGSGIDVVYEDINGGYDTLVFESSTRAVEFHFYNGKVEVIGGSDMVTHIGGNVEGFVGTDLDDIFVLEAGVSLPSGARLDGGAGNDTIDYSSYGSLRHVILTDVGTIDGFQGTEAAVGSFDNMDVLIGSAFNGDSLTGINADATWTIDTTIQYESTNTLAFSGFESLLGGSGADTFEVAEGAPFAGTLDGGAGHDMLDLSTHTGETNVVLSGIGLTDGFSGSLSGFAGSFTNLDEILGGSGATDKLTGIDADATLAFGHGLPI